MLYPLSYWGISSFYFLFICTLRKIRTTYRLGGGRSILLSYSRRYEPILPPVCKKRKGFSAFYGFAGLTFRRGWLKMGKIYL